MTVRDFAPGIFLAAAFVLCLAGVGGFVFIFARDFNVYWLILSPVIIAIYQLPAVYFFWLYKRARRRRGRAAAERPGTSGDLGRP